MQNEKYKLLRRSVIYDAVGMLTYLVPFVGPFLDILWAPYAAKKMSEMYKGKEGKIASVIVFLEELLPMTDFIPTFTLMWMYTFVWKKAPQSEPQIIEVEVMD
jgi:hypothetical protein